MSRAALAIVLHTHMPYVEGFGTWPFGEEWLWEAIATCYLPLLDVLDAAPGRITLSLTPVLADQLEAPGALERCLRFLREVRAETHRRDIARGEPRRGGGARALGRPLRAARPTRSSAAATSLGAFAPHVTLDLGGDARGAAAARHRRRRAPAARDRDRGAPGALRRLGRRAVAARVRATSRGSTRLLEEAGVHATCVDFTDLRDRPRRCARARRARCSCRSTARPIDLVWSERGYPSRAPYRDSHAPHRVPAPRLGDRRRRLRRGGGARARRAPTRATSCSGRAASCALDTELLGHFWHEGPAWLAAVIEEATRRTELRPLDALLGDAEPAPAELPATSWGSPRDLSTWSAPAAGGLAWRQRSAELRMRRGAGERALRELLALQSSDWAFLIARGTAGDYPRERFEGHYAAFEQALGGSTGGPLRNLAPHMP